MRRAWQIRLFATALAIGAVVVIAPAGRAVAAGCGVGSPCLRVHVPGGGVEVVSGDQIAAQATSHSDCVQYPERIAAGDPVVDGPCVLTFLSVHALLGTLLPALTPPIAPASIETTKLVRPFNGTGSFLTGADLDDPSDFADPTLLPAFYLSGNGGSLLQYVRPLTSNPADVNASDDVIQTPTDGEALDLYLYTGPLLTARATRSAGTIKVGQSVTFTAQSAGATSYRWDFGDGTTGNGLTVTHTFQVAGTPQILLSVSGPHDATGEAKPVSVTVTGTETSPSVSASPGGGQPHHPTSSAPHPSTASGVGPGKGGGSPGGRTGGAATATSDGGVATPVASPTATPGDPTSDPHRTSTTPSADGSLPVVRGRVIGAAGNGSVRPAAPAAAPESATPQPVGRGSSGRALAGGGSGVAIMLLLGAGAASERRWVRGRKRMMGRQ